LAGTHAETKTYPVAHSQRRDAVAFR